MDRAQRFMTTAMLLSALAHVVPIVGVRFVMPALKQTPANEPLEIVLVNQRTQTAPSQHDVLAQANLDGGGNTDAKVRAKSPLPAAQRDPALEKVVEQQKQLEDTADKLMTRLKADSNLQSLDKSNQPKTDAKGFDAESLKQQAREMSATAAQISRDYNAYNEKPRKAFIGVRAKQTSVALWADTWTQKIERTGTYAYPKDVHGHKLRGQLRITVEINHDGSILNTHIDRSSGNKELDEQALRILRLASPFSRLPPDMMDDIGKPATVLVITRSWIFGRDDSLGLD